MGSVNLRWSVALLLLVCFGVVGALLWGCSQDRDIAAGERVLIGSLIVQVPDGYCGWVPSPELIDVEGEVEARVVLTPDSTRRSTVYIDQHQAAPTDTEWDGEWGIQEYSEREIHVTVNGRPQIAVIRELRDVEPSTFIVQFAVDDTSYEVTVVAGSDAFAIDDVEELLPRLFPQ